MPRASASTGSHCILEPNNIILAFLFRFSLQIFCSWNLMSLFVDLVPRFRSGNDSSTTTGLLFFPLMYAHTSFFTASIRIFHVSLFPFPSVPIFADVDVVVILSLSFSQLRFDVQKIYNLKRWQIFATGRNTFRLIRLGL